MPGGGATRTLTVVLAGDSTGAVGALNETDSAFGNLGKVAGVAGIATVGALAAIGVKGVANIVTLQNSLSEVRTLLPTLTDEGFNKLRDDVIAFSSEMGVATADAVPALYSAISAGVPPDNAIEFMKTATKAAVGGVTDLETAVDGITTVVNSFGADIITAGEASDIMFTAVKLGKTTFEELSSSLSNVTPIASAMGVGFDEVAASLAVLTAQGVPTSVATTQIRSAITELTKVLPSGSTVVQSTLGKTLQELQAEGLSFGDVLDAMRTKLGDVGFQSAFGSIEAYQAALAVTGKNAESFNTALAEMQTSAGATDAAFAVMSDTVSFKWDKALIQVDNMLTNIGIVLLPIVEKALDALGPVIETVSTFLTDKLIPGLIDLLAKAGSIATYLADTFGPVITAIVIPVQNVVTEFLAFVSAGDSLKEKLKLAGEFLIAYVTDTLLPGLLAKAIELKDALVGWVANVWPGMKEKALTLLTSLKTWLSDTALPAIREKGGELKDAAIEWVGNVWPGMKEKALTLLTSLKTWLSDTALPAIREKGGELKDAAIEWVGNVWPGMKEKLVTFISTITSWYTGTYLPFLVEQAVALKDAAVEWVPKIWTAMKPKIVAFLDSLKTWLSDTALPALKIKLGEWKDAAAAWIGEVWPPLKEKALTLLTSLKTWLSDTALPALKIKLGEWGTAFIAWIPVAITDLTAKISGIADFILKWISSTAAKLGPKLIEWINEFTKSIENIGTKMEHTGEADQGPSPLVAIGKAIFGYIYTMAIGIPLKILQLIPPLTLWIATSLVPALATALLAVGVALWAYFTDTLLPEAKIKMADLGSKMATALGDALKAGMKTVANALIGIINSLIDKWNGIEFKIPGFKKSFGGKFGVPKVELGFDDFTIGVPDIPKIPNLAEGGIAEATPGGQEVRVGEGKRDEAILPLPSDWRSRVPGSGGGNTYILNVDASGGDPVRVAEVLFPALQQLENDGSIVPVSA